VLRRKALPSGSNSGMPKQFFVSVLKLLLALKLLFIIREKNCFGISPLRYPYPFGKDSLHINSAALSGTVDKGGLLSEQKGGGCLPLPTHRITDSMKRYDGTERGRRTQSLGYRRSQNRTFLPDSKPTMPHKTLTHTSVSFCPNKNELRQ
jgi:hypothetical protein